MTNLFLIGIISLFTSLTVHAGDKQLEVISAIRNGCDETTILTLLKETELSEEMVFEALKKTCIAPMKDSQFKAWVRADGMTHSQHVVERYLEYFSNVFLPPLKKSIENGGDLSKEEINLEGVGASTEIAKTIADAGCKPETKNSELCKIAPKMKEKAAEFLSLLERVQKNQKVSQANDPYEVFCSPYFDMKYDQERLEKEKEVGKESGFVDGEKMHELGINIAAVKRKLSRLETDYKKNSGHAFDYKKCPAKYNAWASAEE